LVQHGVRTKAVVRERIWQGPLFPTGPDQLFDAALRRPGLGPVMNVSGYNEYLSRLTRRVGQALSNPLPRGNRIAEHLATPYMQVDSAVLAQALDDFIREHLFRETFEPFEDEQWRRLLLQPVIDHRVKVFGLALVKS